MSDKGVNVSVIASRDKIGQAKFALDSAAKIMDFYDSFFGVKYPLPKQGMCVSYIVCFFSSIKPQC